ncbi:kinase-like domain-containing protein [Daldinia sp. FL1419]|nr:kinase-like domain-containing protein [Daldinia sp. FL1419]
MSVWSLFSTSNLPSPVSPMATMLFSHSTTEKSAAREALRTLKKHFEENYETVYSGRAKFQKVLGWGGFGIATLWKIKTPDNRRIDVAVKSSIIKSKTRAKEKELRKEINIMGTLLNGAEHIVQLINIEPNLPTYYNDAKAPQPVMVMEVLKHGSLSELIDKINKARLTNLPVIEIAENPWGEGRYNREDLKLGYIPNRILWRFFLCLARAITGMAYGPPIQVNLYENVNKWREVYRAAKEPNPLIHFDLDIYNVLCGDIDHSGRDSEHAFAPIIKVSDFGLALQWPKNSSPGEREMMSRRGKPSFYAPEQKNADVAADDPDAMGIAINVWAIGLIMLNLLTLAHPKLSHWEPRVRSYSAPYQGDPNYKQKFVTWGWFLLDDEEHHISPFLRSFDYELRLLIARCLETYGPRRPTAQQLLDVILANINQSDAKHERLAARRIPQEEKEYRDSLIREEEMEAEAMVWSDLYDPLFQESMRYGRSTRPRSRNLDDPLAVDPNELNQWMEQMDIETVKTLTMEPQLRGWSRSQPPPSAGISTWPRVPTPPPLSDLIHISRTDSIDQPDTPRLVDFPPGFDPNRPMRTGVRPKEANPISVVNQWPIPPALQNATLPVVRPKTPAADKVITRNDYRPVSEFQTPPELEDDDLLKKFYDDHFRNPPETKDDYAKLWNRVTPNLASRNPSGRGSPPAPVRPGPAQIINPGFGRAILIPPPTDDDDDDDDNGDGIDRSARKKKGPQLVGLPVAPPSDDQESIEIDLVAMGQRQRLRPTELYGPAGGQLRHVNLPAGPPPPLHGPAAEPPHESIPTVVVGSHNDPFRHLREGSDLMEFNEELYVPPPNPPAYLIPDPLQRQDLLGPISADNGPDAVSARLQRDRDYLAPSSALGEGLQLDDDDEDDDPEGNQTGGVRQAVYVVAPGGTWQRQHEAAPYVWEEEEVS